MVDFEDNLRRMLIEAITLRVTAIHGQVYDRGSFILVVKHRDGQFSIAAPGGDEFVAHVTSETRGGRPNEVLIRRSRRGPELCEVNGHDFTVAAVADHLVRQFIHSPIGKE